MTTRDEVATEAGVSIPATTTIYTHRLAGATLDELLRAAEDDVWPNSQCIEEWALLRNWAIQAETLTIDESEDRAWERQMRDLRSRGLSYEAWTAARLEALRERIRARKLGQANLRYKYGYRGTRRWGLVRDAVREFCRQRAQ